MLGLKSARFGTLTFGRQVTLLSEGTIKYDPNYNATAFGLLGASNTYSGGGSSEDNRLDSTAKYYVSFNDLVHLAGLVQVQRIQWVGQHRLPGRHRRCIRGRIDRCLLFEGQQRHHGDILDRRASRCTSGIGVFGIEFSGGDHIGQYDLFLHGACTTSMPFKFFAGYMHIKYANPIDPAERRIQ